MAFVAGKSANKWANWTSRPLSFNDVPEQPLTLSESLKTRKEARRTGDGNAYPNSVHGDPQKYAEYLHQKRLAKLRG